MRILIDTHVFIWHLEGDKQLAPDHRYIIADPANNVLISIASFWEIAIKSSLGKLTLSKSIEEIVAEVANSTSAVLAIEPKHAIQVSQLPFLHKDPFDRMIISQALTEDVPLISVDPEFQQYGVELL